MFSVVVYVLDVEKMHSNYVQHFLSPSSSNM